MATKLKFFPLYAADFMNDERYKEMGFPERGLYLTLLLHAWVEGSIPDDPVRIARVAGATKDEFAELWPLVSPCFVPGEPGRLVNPRMEKERAEALEICATRSRVAKEMHSKRRANAQQVQPPDHANAEQMQSTSDANALHLKLQSHTQSQIQETRSVSSLRSETGATASPPTPGPAERARAKRSSWVPSPPPDTLPPRIPTEPVALRDYARWFMSEYGNVRNEELQKKRATEWVRALDQLQRKGASTLEAARCFTRARNLKGGEPLWAAECKTVPPLFDKGFGAKGNGRSGDSNTSRPATVVPAPTLKPRESLRRMAESMTPEQRAAMEQSAREAQERAARLEAESRREVEDRIARLEAERAAAEA